MFVHGVVSVGTSTEHAVSKCNMNIVDKRKQHIAQKVLLVILRASLGWMQPSRVGEQIAPKPPLHVAVNNIHLRRETEGFN